MENKPVIGGEYKVRSCTMYLMDVLSVCASSCDTELQMFQRDCYPVETKVDVMWHVATPFVDG
jgi:hypothetical protein